jgi:hypothetical protein
MRGETAVARVRLGRTEGRKSSNRSARRDGTVVRNVRNCAANSLNVLRRCGHRSSSLRRSPLRASARDDVAGVVGVEDAAKRALRQRLAHRQQRIRVLPSNGRRARLVLRVRRK